MIDWTRFFSICASRWHCWRLFCWVAKWPGSSGFVLGNSGGRLPGINMGAEGKAIPGTQSPEGDGQEAFSREAGKGSIRQGASPCVLGTLRPTTDQAFATGGCRQRPRGVPGLWRYRCGFWVSATLPGVRRRTLFTKAPVAWAIGKAVGVSRLPRGSQGARIVLIKHVYVFFQG